MTNTVQSDADKAVAAKHLENLKARAATLGVSHHPSIGAANLQLKIDEHMAANPADEPATPIATVAQTAAESLAQKNSRMRKEATRLIRVRITCMNPAKTAWTGEYFTAGNAVVGSHTKFVPYNNEEGWHVPVIILNMIKERKCQIFVPKKTGKGKEGKLIKEFAIDYMTPLTGKEISDLKTKQAMSHSID